MNKERIIKTDNGNIIIAESVYNDTHKDYKGVWDVDREGAEEYMGKRTWMPPFSLFNTTCLLVEDFGLDIISDKEFSERYGY